MVRIISSDFASDFMSQDEYADGVIYDREQKDIPQKTRRGGPRPRAQVTNTKPPVTGTIRTTTQGVPQTTRVAVKPQVVARIRSGKNK